MDLCHCSKSSCSSCGLAAGTGVCVCLAARRRPCQECAEAGRAAQEAAKRESDATKQLATRERDLADLKKKLADARTSAQSERELRSVEGQAHKAKLLELEVEMPLASAERMAELERAAHLAVNMEAAAESKRKSAEKQLSQAKEELREMRERTRRAEELVALAQDAERVQTAEAEEAAQTERRLSAQLRAAQAERDALQAEADGAAALRVRLAESESKHDELQKEVARLGVQLSQQHEHKLSYEGAVAEGRKLRALLDAAKEEAKQSARRADEQQSRADALTAERAQLQHALDHAEKVRSLFASVTSRTNQVQEAANEVIASVAARKRAAAEAELAAAERATEPEQRGGGGEAAVPRTRSAGGDGDSARGGPPIKPREGWASHSARGPLQAKQQLLNAPTGTGQWAGAPQPPHGARKALPPGRQGVRSVLTPR